MPESGPDLPTEQEPPPPSPPIALRSESPLPAESATPPIDELPKGEERTIPLAEEKWAAAPPPRPSRDLRPALAQEPPLWERPEETGGRRFFGTLVMVAVVGVYAWMLSFFYSGGHPSVDQAGYLMTARLIAGDFNPDNPTSEARPARAATSPTTAPGTAPAVWAGGASGYTALHPEPAWIQKNSYFDWLRNRLSFVPESPFQFGSLMDVMTEPFGPASADLPRSTETAPAAKPAEYRYYAKYPFGYSLMAAVGRKVAAIKDHPMMKVAPPAKKASASAPAIAIEPPSTQPATSQPTQSTINNGQSTISFPRVGRGIDGMYIITPLCTVLACFFSYFLFRQVVSSFTALIGVLWLATNPIVLTFAYDANSHAPTLMCVSLGFWGLVSYLRTRATWRGCIGAFALGYACTIRYSEFMMVLPVAYAAAVTFRPSWKRLLSSAAVLISWAIPVFALAFICWIAFGSPTKTGYTYCNEDTGFGWKYITGNWPDRQMTANWQTLLDQFNRSGLFMMWPLALAGLFGMIGASWRLGGLIAAWVLPTLVVYLAYYWAPALGDQVAVYYLRFFVGIIPGLLFAALWLLERGMQVVQTHRSVAMTLATALPLVLLLIVAFYADGGPRVIDGGLGKMVFGLIHQFPAALFHLFSSSRLGLTMGLFLLALIPAIWLFDRNLMASRIGIALGAGVITAIGCAINLQTVRPTLDSSFVTQLMSRQNVDNLREVLPRGTAIIGDNFMLQALDCVGGWKLYDASAFSIATYNTATGQLAKRTNPDHREEPFPMQDQRWQFYKELLSRANGSSISLAQMLEMERAVIEKNMTAGNRVVYVELTESGDETRQSGPNGVQMLGGNMRNFRLPPGFEKRAVRKWTLSAMPENVPGDPLSAFGPQRTTAAPPKAETVPAARNELAREGPTFVLWEIVKK